MREMSSPVTTANPIISSASIINDQATNSNNTSGSYTDLITSDSLTTNSFYDHHNDANRLPQQPMNIAASNTTSSIISASNYYASPAATAGERASIGNESAGAEPAGCHQNTSFYNNMHHHQHQNHHHQQQHHHQGRFDLDPVTMQQQQQQHLHEAPPHHAHHPQRAHPHHSHQQHHIAHHQAAAAAVAATSPVAATHCWQPSRASTASASPQTTAISPRIQQQQQVLNHHFQIDHSTTANHNHQIPAVVAATATAPYVNHASATSSYANGYVAASLPAQATHLTHHHHHPHLSQHHHQQHSPLTHQQQQHLIATGQHHHYGGNHEHQQHHLHHAGMIQNQTTPEVDVYAAADQHVSSATYSHQYAQQVHNRLAPTMPTLAAASVAVDPVSPYHHHQYNSHHQHHQQHGIFHSHQQQQQQQHPQHHLNHNLHPQAMSGGQVATSIKEAVEPAISLVAQNMQQTNRNLSPMQLAGGRTHQQAISKSQRQQQHQLRLTISETSNAPTTPNTTTPSSGGRSTPPKPFATSNNNNSPASINMQSSGNSRRQSSSVVSTASSVGSNLSDQNQTSPNDSPTSVTSIQCRSTANGVLLMSTVNSELQDKSSGEERLSSAGGVMTGGGENELGDSKESQLSQLHQQCAELLDDHQQNQAIVAINSPNNNGTNASNCGGASQQSNYGNNNNSSNGNNVGRNKRLRTSFKHHQLKEMKKWFAQNQNPDAKDLKTLAHATGLSKRVLQVWFQNARAKDRRTKNKAANQQGYDVNQHHASRMLQFQQQQQQQQHHHQAAANYHHLHPHQNQQSHHHHQQHHGQSNTPVSVAPQPMGVISTTLQPVTAADRLPSNIDTLAKVREKCLNCRMERCCCSSPL